MFTYWDDDLKMKGDKLFYKSSITCYNNVQQDWSQKRSPCTTTFKPGTQFLRSFNDCLPLCIIQTVHLQVTLTIKWLSFFLFLLAFVLLLFFLLKKSCKIWVTSACQKKKSKRQQEDVSNSKCAVWTQDITVHVYGFSLTEAKSGDF